MTAYQRTVTTANNHQQLLYFSGRSPYSNFYRAPFVIEGRRYFNVEQWYQASKARTFGDEEIELAILSCPSPRECKSLGYAIKHFDMGRWKEVCDEIMRRGVTEKFSQNPELRKELLATDCAELIEATQYDSWWGSGRNITEEHDTYPGLNKMGLILMCVRRCLNNV